MDIKVKVATLTDGSEVADLIVSGTVINMQSVEAAEMVANALADMIEANSVALVRPVVEWDTP